MIIKQISFFLQYRFSGLLSQRVIFVQFKQKQLKQTTSLHQLRNAIHIYEEFNLKFNWVKSKIFRLSEISIR